MSNRREFITLAGGAAIAGSPLVRAQEINRLRRIGHFMTIAESDPEAWLRRDALHRRLEELGWTDARGVRFDYRWPGPDPDRIKTSARELVGLAPDVMLAHTPAGVVALRTIGKRPVIVI